MEKRVRRVEANVNIGSKLSPKKSPLKEQSTLGFLDANTLAEKYGVAEKAEAIQPPPPVFSAVQQRSEVDMLRKLEEKNKKIDQLCTLLEALEPAPGVDPERIQRLMDEGVDENVDFRDAKIVSLAKKSHRLTQQLNKEKSVTDKLNQQVLELQKNMGSLNQELQATKASYASRTEPKVYNRNVTSGGEGTSVEDYLTKIAGLSRDVKEGNKQVEELKRKLAQSVDEAKQLSRALTREIGEGVALEDAVSGGWRGRAQQIVMLKNKIKRMEAGEGVNGGAVVSSGYGVTPAGSRSTAGSVFAGGVSSNSLDVDRKAEEDLQTMSNDRRQIVDALTEERAGLIEANQHLEKRSTAQKARIQNLEGEVRKLKDNLQMVLDKSGTDDQLLEALREEIARLKAQQLAHTQHQHLHHSSGTSTYGGRSNADGISSKFGSSSVGTSAIRTSGQQVLLQAGNRSFSAVDNLGDSLDFLQIQQAQQQENWEAEQKQMQSEIQRLRRLCKNQADQLETQDGTIRQLKKKLDTDFRN